MNQLARNLACEWASDGIRANAIAPAVIATPLAEAVRSNCSWKIPLYFDDILTLILHLFKWNFDFFPIRWLYLGVWWRIQESSGINKSLGALREDGRGSIACGISLYACSFLYNGTDHLRRWRSFYKWLLVSATCLNPITKTKHNFKFLLHMNCVFYWRLFFFKKSEVDKVKVLFIV